MISKGISIWIWVGEYIDARDGIIYKRIQKSYDTYKYTKVLEEVVAKVMQVDKAVESFQTMAIMSLNMGNLNLEVSNLKNILTTKMKEKVILQMKLAKDKHF